MRFFLAFVSLLSATLVFSQVDTSYKKRVLEAAEIELFFSYYGQEGQHAAVTGGVGSQKLTDASSALIVSIPLNADDVLTAEVGISAYTSASSSNVNPFDGDADRRASPFSASSGASRKDELVHFRPTYTHSSDDRNSVITAKGSISSEYDYFSIGSGGGYSHKFNEQNTEISFSGTVYFDQCNPQYPIELRDGFFDSRIRGNGTYTPDFKGFKDTRRNSYALSLGLSQILGAKVQGSVFIDAVLQEGLLSTPFQRVYFEDTENFFVEGFQLADDVERLPERRFKLPVGGRVNYYLNDVFVLRSYYRFYRDDWGVAAHTANLEVPVKLSDAFTLYPNYRFHTQSAADYFYKKDVAQSSYKWYTSDYDLSKFNAHQYGLGIRYKDILTKTKISVFGLKAVDLRISNYSRSDGLDAFILTLGTTFVGS
ncbi:DUF3570 domain-containing protein [Pricia sp. S334]|uniref:DUF3570 domain-containing protein n=1 Tax=Pricia mediterranea TaxID=3076079 RepID=A0ABU3L7Y4_9FLAO|nr:DUF3570 domain-containing protein [Pricia sp. S334]MDT7829668.1 DUF3570 domain-containing protein [Pricia sp. S334]